ncbi:hypothetical protein TRFO_24677 [Tritrichomonas foetus]|uniref:Actin family protein n=1 Tax=Tritrichomonas foetus TaxID=1144522 RepID=A0A1J4KC75_9EUKA|nr:hypothetical protein TRFO_24677 [Tritrichomonas foetus]|eukprot:OHT07262.1 hypothetical protein TRFO_24677 [Tritrichomonas foetus]
MDKSPTTILDPGTGSIKFGVCNFDNSCNQQVYKNLSIPAIYGTPKYPLSIHRWPNRNGKYRHDYQIGKHVHMLYDMLNVTHPVIRGVVKDWDVVMTILEDGLKMFDYQPDDFPKALLISEPWFHSRIKREKMVEIVFEKCDYDKFYSVPQTVLTLYNYGETSGYVLESGYGQTQFTPIFEGHKVQYGCFNFNKGGFDLTSSLAKKLKNQANQFLQLNTAEKNGNCIHTFHHYYELETLKIHPNDAHQVLTSKELETSTLYDEIFFFDTPTVQSGDTPNNPQNLIKLIQESYEILVTDQSENKSMTAITSLINHIPKNLFLGGGNASNKHFQDRIGKGWVNNNPINTLAPDESEWAVWKGGCKFVCHPSIDTYWIKSQEYYETGPNIINLCSL